MASAQSCDDNIRSSLSAPERIAGHADRDAGRRPCEVLTFTEIREGETVLELLGAQGYYTELLSHVVGSAGRVIHHNNATVLMLTPPDQMAPIRRRISEGELTNVTWHESELEDLGLSDGSVDVITAFLALHDYYWMSQQPESTAMKELHRVLKPGGLLIVVDHAAVAGSKTSAAVDQQGLHRIDQQYLTNVLEAIGFEKVAESAILRNPDDDRTKAFFDPSLWRDKTDRFLIKFQKKQPVE